jgi:hypothetical protein
MPEFQFDLEIEVAVTVTAESFPAAKAAVQKEIDDGLLFQFVEQNDTPTVNMTLIAIDNEVVE